MVTDSGQIVVREQGIRYISVANIVQSSVQERTVCIIQLEISALDFSAHALGTVQGSQETYTNESLTFSQEVLEVPSCLALWVLQEGVVV